MTYKTHLIGGAQVGLILASAKADRPTDAALLFGASCLGSILPDIDYAKSKIANQDILIGMTSRILGRFTHHRGFTHTIPGAITFGILFCALSMFNTSSESITAIVAAALGYMAINLAKALKRYGMIVALTIYFTMPRITELIASGKIILSLSPEAARLGGIGIIAGCLIHDFYDAFNKKGIPGLLWPLSKKNIRLGGIKYNGAGESIFAICQLAALCIIAIGVFKDSSIVEIASRLISDITTALTKML